MRFLVPDVESIAMCILFQKYNFHDLRPVFEILARLENFF